MHLEQLPSGRWRVTVSVNGQRGRATKDTKTAAKMKGAELMIALGGAPAASDVTVVELLAAHLDQHERLGKSATL